MKKTIGTAILWAVVAMSCKSQSTYSNYNGKKWEQITGNGKMVNTSPAISAFSVLEVAHMNARVKVETGFSEYALLVSIDENLQSFFRYKQEGNALRLSFDLSGGKYDRWLSNNNTVITIKVPALPELMNAGNGTIEITNLDQEQFKLVSSGNADITLSGKVEQAELKTTGNSDINAGSLETQKTFLSSSGNATIVVNAKEFIQTGMDGNNDVSNLFGKSLSPSESEEKAALEMIRFKFRNNSLLPTKLSVISYRPDETGNGTNAFFLIPYGTRAFKFPEGTKIFLANQEQVNTVMSGASIVSQKPFLIVSKSLEGKAVNIND